MEMIKRYITKQPKVIVMLRPIDEIVKSFEKLYQSNNVDKDVSLLLEEGSEPLMRSLDGVEQAQKNNSGEFLFIQYRDLVNDTANTIKSIYQHCGLEIFEHNLANIVNKFPEDDSVYGLEGMHVVRPTIMEQTNTSVGFG